jgi:hypothetical protein
MNASDSKLLKSRAIESIVQDLSRGFREQSWQSVLKAIGLMGVIDNQQLIELTGLQRDSLARTIERINQIAFDPPLFHQLTLKLVRGKIGRCPKVYTLLEAGAAVLRYLGDRFSRPYQESNPIGISHDLCILDCYVFAWKSNKHIKLEERIYYADKEYILPDLLLQQESGKHILFEIEQSVKPNYLRRMSEGLEKRREFFESETGRLYSPIIRMLVNVQPNSRELEITLSRWRQLIGSLAAKNRGKLAFKVFAMPLLSFMENPDWSDEPNDDGWQDLSLPAANSTKMIVPQSSIPAGLLRRSDHENAIVLESLWDWFLEYGENQIAEYAMPDIHFLEVANIIFLASHQPVQRALCRAAFPHASLFLLNKYLNMHPVLRQHLRSAILRGGNAMRWNPTTILSRMQATIDTFLNYHGWNNRELLVVSPTVSAWNDIGPKDYGISVKISSEEILLRESEGVLPGREEVHNAEQALAWLLWALMAYSNRLGLPDIAFW